MKIIYSLSLYSIFIVTFVNEIVTVNPLTLKLLTVSFVLVLIFSSLYLTRGFQFWVSLICLIIGHLLIFVCGLSFDVWYSALTRLVAIAVLFVAIPMISFPVKYGDYLSAIENFLGKFRKRTSLLFIFMSLLHTSLALTLDIGSIPTMQGLIGHINLPKKYLARLYTSGYASFVVFSPYSGLVNLLLVLAATSYASYFSAGLIMLIFIVGITVIFIKFDKTLMQQLRETMPYQKKNFSIRKIYELAFLIALLVFLAVIAGEIVPVSNVIYAITLVLILYSVIWGSFIRILNSYIYEFKHYNNNILAYKCILPFLICTGFLGEIISKTGLGANIQGLFLYLNCLPLYFVLFSLILLTMICSVCGIHMMIPVITMAMTLSPEMLNVSPPAFVLTLLSCWYIAMCITPFAPFAAITSESIDENILILTFKYNLKYAIVMLFISPGIIMLFN